MVPEWLTALSPYFIAGAGLGSGYIVARVNKGKSRENDLINQLQEERDSAVEQKKLQEESTLGRIEALEQKSREQETREYTLIDYIFELWTHIHEGKGPPPPTMPVMLLGNRKKDTD